MKPSGFRLIPLFHQLDRVGVLAVPIIALITFLIGGIIAQQGIFHFRKFGADSYVVDLVGILVLREIGVLIGCYYGCRPLRKLIHGRNRFHENEGRDRCPTHHGP